MRLSCTIFELQKVICQWLPAVATAFGGDAVRISPRLWCLKTRVPELSCGVVSRILRLAVLTQYRRVTDGQTDKHTKTAITCASI